MVKRFRMRPTGVVSKNAIDLLRDANTNVSETALKEDGSVRKDVLEQTRVQRARSSNPVRYQHEQTPTLVQLTRRR